MRDEEEPFTPLDSSLILHPSSFDSDHPHVPRLVIL
jgi:hypothetical protein